MTHRIPLFLSFVFSVAALALAYLASSEARTVSVRLGRLPAPHPQFEGQRAERYLEQARRTQELLQARIEKNESDILERSRRRSEDLLTLQRQIEALTAELSSLRKQVVNKEEC